MPTRPVRMAVAPEIVTQPAAVIISAVGIPWRGAIAKRRLRTSHDSEATDDLACLLAAG